MRKSTNIFLTVLILSLFVYPVLARKFEGERIILNPGPPLIEYDALSVDEAYHVRHGWMSLSKAENKLIKNWTFELYIDDEPIKMKHRYFFNDDGFKVTSFYVYFEANHFTPGIYNLTGIWRDNGIEAGRAEHIITFY